MVKKVGELPPRRAGSIGIDWAQVCADVEAEGGEWCEVGEFSPSAVTHIRRGRYPAVDPEKFEVTSQRVTPESTKSMLYMRLRVSE